MIESKLALLAKIHEKIQEHKTQIEGIEKMMQENLSVAHVYHDNLAFELTAKELEMLLPVVLSNRKNAIEDLMKNAKKHLE